MRSNDTEATPFSHLSDGQFVEHLLDKADPTAEDVEAALRLQLLTESYCSLLEDIHRAAVTALEAGNAECKRAALARIKKLTAPRNIQARPSCVMKVTLTAIATLTAAATAAASVPDILWWHPW